MKRIPWDIVLALIVGIGLGLVYAWLILPLKVTNANPATLREDFKEQYRSAIAAAYAATGNLPRARSRLDLLKDTDPIQALNAQAQQMLSKGESGKAADQVAALAQALKGGTGEPLPASSPVPEAVASVEETNAATVVPISTEDLMLVLTEVPVAIPSEATQPVLPSSAPPPTGTPVPTQGIPFKLTGQEEVCDPNLPDGLLQVIVLSASRRQLPGIEIDITWEGDEEQFFTGLKPELGNGYADFVMTPDVSYTVQLATGSDIATGLTAPTCQSPSGETFHGGMKLTFQQP